MSAQSVTPAFLTYIKDLYGEALSTEQLQRYQLLKEQFAAYFPADPEPFFFSTPGRTEIMGNHTDHQHGHVLCASVNMDIIAAVVPVNKPEVILKSYGYDKADHIDLNILEPQAAEREHSAALIRGVARAFRDRGAQIGGYHAYTMSNVPAGSGLSSSAAFEVLNAAILNTLYNQSRFDAVELARISQFAENRFFGKPSGLMDQCGCAVGGFIAIDFADPEKAQVTRVPLDFADSGYSMIITKTGGSHADLTDEYAAIPREMKAVAQALGQEVLQQVDPQVFYRELPALRQSLGDRAVLRAMHFFDEDQRVLAAGRALEAHNIQAFLNILRASGLSSWRLLQNVTSSRSDHDQPVTMALAYSEHLLGSQGYFRVHGGGFAGTIQAFVPLALKADYLNGMRRVFGEANVMEVGIRPCGTRTYTPETRPGSAVG
ncbi:MAG: galactokinase family protein [Oscillospiraceae bacterium]|nr:galactokinase family protein [Oscillospiraceae bacterium]MDD4367740.1 galactokinase family protein [Oscillospiraceae bacterium]